MQGLNCFQELGFIFHTHTPHYRGKTSAINHRSWMNLLLFYLSSWEIHGHLELMMLYLSSTLHEGSNYVIMMSNLTKRCTRMIILIEGECSQQNTELVQSYVIHDRPLADTFQRSIFFTARVQTAGSECT